MLGTHVWVRRDVHKGESRIDADFDRVVGQSLFYHWDNPVSQKPDDVHAVGRRAKLGDCPERQSYQLGVFATAGYQDQVAVQVELKGEHLDENWVQRLRTDHRSECRCCRVLL